MRIQLLRSLGNMQELCYFQTSPALKFHALSGNYAGRYAIKIDARRRMILRPVAENDDEDVRDLKTIHTVVIEEVTDYHD